MSPRSPRRRVFLRRAAGHGVDGGIRSAVAQGSAGKLPAVGDGVEIGVELAVSRRGRLDARRRDGRGCGPSDPIALPAGRLAGAAAALTDHFSVPFRRVVRPLDPRSPRVVAYVFAVFAVFTFTLISVRDDRG